MDKYDIIIIGSGVAGYSAGLYSRRYQRKTLVLEGKSPGGWASIAGTIENYPGVKAVGGYDLVKVMKDQNTEIGVDIKSETVESVEKKKDGEFVIKSNKEEYLAKTVVLAHGTNHRKLGIDNEEELMGKGVGICAICDAPLFKNKVVAVVGGGDSSIKGVNLLCEYAKHVYLISRDNELHGEPINMARMKDKKNHQVIYENEVTQINGDKMLESIQLKNEFEGKKVLEVGGLFVMIGFIAQTEYFKTLGVELDDRDFINVDKFMQTNVKGVLGAGDCTNGTGSFKQIVIAAAQGAMAATSANKYIEELG